MNWKDFKKKNKPQKPKRGRKKGRFQHGYYFENELAKSMDSLIDYGYNIYYRKLTDTNLFDISLWCNHCSRKVTHNLILPKAISDFVLMSDMGTHFIEAKSSKQKVSFPLTNIKEHQLQSGLVINTFKHTTYHYLICNRYTKGDYKCYVLDSFQLDDLMSHVYPRKSLKWTEIEAVAITLPKLTGMWDMIPFMNLLGIQEDE